LIWLGGIARGTANIMGMESGSKACFAVWSRNPKKNDLLSRSKSQIGDGQIGLASLGSLDIVKDKFLKILRRICAPANKTILVHPLGIVQGDIVLLSNNAPLEDREGRMLSVQTESATCTSLDIKTGRKRSVQKGRRLMSIAQDAAWSSKGRLSMCKESWTTKIRDSKMCGLKCKNKKAKRRKG